MSKKLNLWFFIITAFVLIILLVLDNALSINVKPAYYHILVGPAVAALGNYIVIRIRMRKTGNIDTDI